MTGVATAVHLGRTSATYEVVITDERGKRVCTSRITCALMPAANLRSDPAAGLADAAQPRASPAAACAGPAHRTAGGQHLGELAAAGARHRGSLRGQLGAHDRGRGHPQHGLRPEREPGHEPVGVAGARGGGGRDVPDAELLGVRHRGVHQRPADPAPAVLREHVRRDGLHDAARG